MTVGRAQAARSLWRQMRKGNAKEMLGINTRVEDLREQIIKDINKAQMPACLLDYVLTEILNDVRMKRMGEIQKERKKYKEEMTPAPGEAPIPK